MAGGGRPVDPTTRAWEMARELQKICPKSSPLAESSGKTQVSPTSDSASPLRLRVSIVRVFWFRNYVLLKAELSESCVMAPEDTAVTGGATFGVWACYRIPQRTFLNTVIQRPQSPVTGHEEVSLWTAHVLGTRPPRRSLGRVSSVLP